MKEKSKMKHNNMISKISPNSDRDEVNKYCDQECKKQVEKYPQFFCEIKFAYFRHIQNLDIKFNTPITVISGSNKSGKTSILLSIACSHYNFHKRDYLNSNNDKRVTWGDVMKFTNFDQQDKDWTYYVTFRNGNRFDTKRGQRKQATKKWNGVAKKESQIGTPGKHGKSGRFVYLIDLDRIVPARRLSVNTFKKAKDKENTILQDHEIIDQYLSYILERNYKVGLLYANVENEVFSYEYSGYKYSSYNTASGEDVLTRIVEDIVRAKDNSLILIEEIEIGLHPKIQRRLMDILYHESIRKHKQFIVTTHSATILGAVSPKSRVFIENVNDSFRAISGISINAALTKMDAITYPLVNIYVEDDISKEIVKKAIDSINQERNGFSNLVRVVPVGPAGETYSYFKKRKMLYQSESVNAGYACILDGDTIKEYKKEELLFFLFPPDPPEKMLLRAFLEYNPNDILEYHYKESNVHSLFNKMVEAGICSDTESAFNLCWENLMKGDAGKQSLQELKDFIKGACKYFSPNL